MHYFYKNFIDYGKTHKSLYVLSLMFFFFVLFDGIVSFVTPLAITGAGISETMMGVIIGFSSLAGIFFDFLLCRVFKNTNFRKLLLLMFIVCLSYPLILWKAQSVFLFLIAMAMWGLYYDLFNLSSLDFVGRKVKKEEYVSSFGVIKVFSSLGYLLAPLIAGLLIGKYLNFTPFGFAWLFLIIAILFYFSLLFVSKREGKEYIDGSLLQTLSTLKELELWWKIGRFILPVLFLTLMINMIDATFWTIGPLLSESLTNLGKAAGLFLVAYQLPPLFVGWIVGSITAKKGKKKTAFYALLIGSLFLSSFFLIENTYVLLITCFFASFFLSMAGPAAHGAHADYVVETSSASKEIVTLCDSFVNLGYIIGPILAGFLGQNFGHVYTFAILGSIGVIVAAVLILVTPKEINIKI